MNSTHLPKPDAVPSPPLKRRNVKRSAPSRKAKGAVKFIDPAPKRVPARPMSSALREIIKHREKEEKQGVAHTPAPIEVKLQEKHDRHKELAKQATAYLEGHAIDPGYAWQRGACAVDAATAKKEGSPIAHPAIMLTPFLPDTNEEIAHVIGGRRGKPLRYFRFLEPLPKYNDGKETKFRQSINSRVEAWFDPVRKWGRIFRNPKKDLFIPQGPFKAMASDKVGIVSIGISSVEGWHVGGSSELTLALRGINWKKRRVTIGFDSDVVSKLGVLNAESRFADALAAAGAEVHALRIPPAPDGSKRDVNDVLKEQGAEGLKKLIRDAPLYNTKTVPVAKGTLTEITIKWSADVTNTKVDFLFHPYIPKGKLSGVIGLPGASKSNVLVSIAASLTKGVMPIGGGTCEPIKVLWMSYEGDPESRTSPRFTAARGDRSRFAMTYSGKDANGNPVPIRLTDVAAIKGLIEKHGFDLVVIDPLQSFLGGEVDMNRANETRPILEALEIVARETSAAIVIVRHIRKDASRGRSTDAGLGSQDIIANFSSELRCRLRPGGSGSSRLDSSPSQ
jgi:hypothetical protein